jgi:hypothetical protein
MGEVSEPIQVGIHTLPSAEFQLRMTIEKEPLIGPLFSDLKEQYALLKGFLVPGAKVVDRFELDGRAPLGVGVRAC